MLFCCTKLKQKKVGLRLVGESKLVRKKVGDAAPRTCDPQFNAKFTFAVSSSKLAEFELQVSVFHADKFGRDVFLGVVHVPLEDLISQNVEDWFPFKQRKPTDKVCFFEMCFRGFVWRFQERFRFRASFTCACLILSTELFQFLSRQRLRSTAQR